MSVRILVGDVRARLAELSDNSVQCVVTSPPYFGLRRYLPDGHDDARFELGSEPTLAAYLAAMVDVFREVKRVLRNDGTCFLNIGDSYFGSSTVGRNDADRLSVGAAGGHGGGTTAPKMGASKRDTTKSDAGLKPKDLMLVPHRLAIALQDSGWYVRSDIIWHKRAPMPESVTDRPTSAHEHIFLLTKSPRYFYDAMAVAEAGSETSHGGTIQKHINGNARKIQFLQDTASSTLGGTADAYGGTRNLRNVWTLSPESFSQAHFATFPTEIPRRAIRAGTSGKGCCAGCGAPWRRVVERTPGECEAIDRPKRTRGMDSGTSTLSLSGNGSKEWAERGGKSITTGWEPDCACNAEVVPCTVLDPFFGAGTTGLVADELGRDCIGIELNPEYAEMARSRIYGAAPMFAAVEVS